jgi:hypothetical protein
LSSTDIAAPRVLREMQALAPAWLCLAIGTLIGYAMPASLARWFEQIAQSLR